MNRRECRIIVVCCGILIASGCATPGEQLEAAAAEGNSARVKAVLAKNPDLEVPARALNLAAEAGDLESVRLLVERGADVNAQEDVPVFTVLSRDPVRGVCVDGEPQWKPFKPAIAYAIANHHVAVVKYLLEHGASVSLRFVELAPVGYSGLFNEVRRWVTVQQVAQESGDAEIVKLVEQKDESGLQGSPGRLEPIPQNAGGPSDKAIDLGGGISMEFVLIPAGTFNMGSPGSEESRNDDEGPVRRVQITRAFYLSKYEVTQDQYMAVIGRNPSGFRGRNLPVEQVSWGNAVGNRSRNAGKRCLCGVILDWREAG